MIMRGSVKLEKFAEFYSLVIKHEAEWVAQPEGDGQSVHFVVRGTDEFKAAACKMFPCLAEPKTVWQTIKTFLKMKGDTCDECC